MSKGTTRGSKPHGLTRFFFRLPIWLYRLHLGWLLGGRFLMIQHTGRKSGLFWAKAKGLSRAQDLDLPTDLPISH